MNEVNNLVVSELNPPLKATVITDDNGLLLLVDFFGRKQTYGFDVETNVAPTFFERKLRTIQLGDKEEQYIIDLLAFAGSEAALMEQGCQNAPSWATAVAGAVAVGLGSLESLKVGTYLQFDCEAVKWNLGVNVRNIHDCMLAEQLIYCGKVNFHQPNFWALDDMVRRYCKLSISKELQKSFDLCSPLTQDQIDYCALDTRLPLAILGSQRAILTKHGLTDIAKIENDAVGAFTAMHLNGFYLDKQAWLEQVEQVKREHADTIKELDGHFLPIVGDKANAPVTPQTLAGLEQRWRESPGKTPEDKAYRAECRKAFYAARKLNSDYVEKLGKYEGQAAINYGSNPQILEVLQGLKIKDKKGNIIQSTGDEILDQCAGEPIVDALRKFRGSFKLLKTYGETFLKHVSEFDGRVHSNIKQIGAESGRTSSTNPNIQNIPHDSEYRECFRSVAGWKLITRDYDSCELRILAEGSGEKSWIDAFNAGEDVHSMCAVMMFPTQWKDATLPGCAYEAKRRKCSCPGHKKLRSNSKELNFGLPYGMGPDALCLKLRSTKQYAKDLITLHQKTFPKVDKYLHDLEDIALATLEARTAAGRRRILTKPDRNKCYLKTIEYFKADGKDPATITKRDVDGVERGEMGQLRRYGRNVPIQGLNADLIKLAMGMMWFELETKWGAKLCNIVHDELVIEVKDEFAEECDTYVAQCMEAAGAVYVKKMRMTSAGVIDTKWRKE